MYKYWVIQKLRVTWCVSEGQSIDDHLSLHGEEKSTPVWTPTAGLYKTHKYTMNTWCRKGFLFLLNNDFEMWWHVFTWQRPFTHGQRSQVHILVSQTLKELTLLSMCEKLHFLSIHYLLTPAKLPTMSLILHMFIKYSWKMSRPRL